MYNSTAGFLPLPCKLSGHSLQEGGGGGGGGGGGEEVISL